MTRARSDKSVKPPQKAASRMFDLVLSACTQDPRVTLGSMFGARAIRVDDKVFAMIREDKLVVKLPERRVQELIAGGVARSFTPRGRRMREWVVIEPDHETRLLALAAEAREFVGSGER